MILDGKKEEEKAILEVARKMCLAAKTAPKAVGADKVRTLILTDEDKDNLCDFLEEIGKENSIDFFIRDAENIRRANCLVLIGVLDKPLNLGNSKYHGFDRGDNCHCTYNMVDLGIALGSAVSIAADNRVDNRIMFSIGKAAIEKNIMGDDIKVCFGIPLSATSKNKFFDRK